MKEAPPRSKWSLLLIGFICGVATLCVAAATVDATDQRAFCGRCHSMAPSAWTHSISTHAQFSCNECHTPHNLVSKLPFKAKVGLHDIYATFTGSAPKTLHASNEMKDVIQANCRRCHVSTVSTVAMDVKPFCTGCHKSVPHNTKLPMDKREAGDV